MVKATKNKRYQYGKLKTGARSLNKWPNVRKSQQVLCILWGLLYFRSLFFYYVQEQLNTGLNFWAYTSIFTSLRLYYESFDLSKTHSLSSQDLVKIFIDSFIHSFIIMTAGEVFLKKNQTKIYTTSSILHQILSNKMVKITKNKGYEHGKVKTGT